MFYSIMTKNLNLETKNLATFKRWDGWEFTEKFDFFSLGEGGESPKKGHLDSLQI